MLRPASIVLLALAACTSLPSFEIGEPGPIAEAKVERPDSDVVPSPDRVERAHAAGPAALSIGCGASAESKYAVDSVASDNPRFGAVSTTIVVDYVDDEAIRGVVGVAGYTPRRMRP